MKIPGKKCDPAGLESLAAVRHYPVGSENEYIRMKKSDLTCPVCHAGYRRIELTSRPGVKGEYRCLMCDEVLETFDGSTDVAIRLTVQSEKTFETPLKPLQ